MLALVSNANKSNSQKRYQVYFLEVTKICAGSLLLLPLENGDSPLFYRERLMRLEEISIVFLPVLLALKSAASARLVSSVATFS